MLTKKEKRKIVIIGTIISLILVLGIIGQHRKYAKQQEELLTQQRIEAEEALEKEENEEKEEEEINIPPIEKPKSTENETETQEYKEEIKEIDGNKVIVKPTPVPNVNKETPEAMKKPAPQPKPKEPPKLKEEGTDKPNSPTKPDKPNEPQKPNPALKNPEKPPTYEEEEPEKEVKGGTGDDGVLRDLQGNPIKVKKGGGIVETKGSDFYEKDENGNPMIPGEGDKF